MEGGTGTTGLAQLVVTSIIRSGRGESLKVIRADIPENFAEKPVILDVEVSSRDSQTSSRWLVEIDLADEPDSSIGDPVHVEALATTLRANLVEWWDTKGSNQELPTQRGRRVS